MANWIDDEPSRPEPLSRREVLADLAAELDRQLVISLGGEFLEGSGFEDEIPEPEFDAEGASNV